MTMQRLKILISILCIGLFLSGCGVNHNGIGPVIPGERYKVTCHYEYTYRLRDSYGMLNAEQSSNVCSNGPPSYTSLDTVCWSLGYRLQSDPAGLFDEITSVSQRGREDPEPLPEPCTISALVSEGNIGSRIDGLTNGGSDTDNQLLSDSSGALLGDVSTSVLKGVVSNADIRVGAKFLAWRYGRTQARGSVSFDGGDCRVNTSCDLILRHLSLDINDFTIVRPTIFARDVTLRDVKLYSTGNYKTTRRGNGSFDLSGIQLMVSAIQNGRRVSFQTTADVTVSGQFGQYLPGGSSAPQLITLRLNDRNDNYYINGLVQFRTVQTQARLRNHGTGRCLRSSFSQAREMPATVESCSTKTQPQTVAIDTRGSAFRFRNSVTNACLNVKSSRQNYDGGTVAWVNCSNHADQLWSVRSDGHVVHRPTGRCLNVHRGRENYNGGRVSIYSCASTPDQRWSVVTPR